MEYVIARASDPEGVFRVDTKGKVTIRTRLDRETSASHEIHVIGKDDGQPPRSATATLIVSLLFILI